jgi:ABC-2 type transport system ATP-binding protein
MSTPIIEVIDIYRHFGEVRAVDGVTFSVMPGQSVGFIGSNGAGKTTTMRIMSTLDMPDKGTVLFNGKNAWVNGASVRSQLGWMPDAYGTYEYVTCFEYLDFFARAYGYRGAERKRRVDEVMGFTELEPLADRFMNGLSKGQAQRLCLGRTLLNDPNLLILDEPAAGLDPEARIRFKHLIRLLAKAGKSIFISSHILTELEDMCDTMLFIDAGKIVHHGSAEILKRDSAESIVVDIKLSSPAEKLQEWLILQPGVGIKEAIRDGLRISVDGGTPEQLAGLLKRLVTDGFPIYEFVEHKRRLEDAFVAMVNRPKDKGNKAGSTQKATGRTEDQR